MNDKFLVVCTDDKRGGKSAYYLATRRVFNTYDEAEKYAATISESRDPVVVEGDFANLRFEGASE